MKTKSILILIVSLFISGNLMAQMQAYLYLRILDKSQNPIAHSIVYITEIETGELFTLTADSKGKTRLLVIKGNNYQIKVDGSNELSQISIPKNGLGTVARDIIRNIEAKTTAAADTLRTDGRQKKPDRTTSAIGIEVLDAEERPLKNIEVALSCKKCNTVWLANTDRSGQAWFNVPINSFLSVSVDNFPAQQSLQLPDRMGLSIRKSIRYQPLAVDEYTSNDTVFQVNTENYRQCTQRVLIELNLYDLQNRPLPDEWVFFDAKDSERVFAAQTNPDGHVKLLLPKGEAFTMNLSYERDIDLFDYPLEFGLHNTQIDMNYIGTVNVENHYKNTRRDKNGFITEFLSSEVTPIAFDIKRFTPTEYGFKIEAGSQLHNATPAIYNDQLIFSGGYYQKELYSIAAEGGRTNWALGLSDNGPSSIIIHENYILIITESCTFYVIDAETGQLAWSKWLGPDIYSTPSAYGNQVFAVYPNKLSALSPYFDHQNADDFVLVAFDLESGEILWQNWLDDEVLASPIPNGDAVFLSTMAGSIYKFDQKTGKMLAHKNIQAVSPPTLTKSEIYVSVKQDSSAHIQRLKAENLDLIAALTNVKGKVFETDFRSIHASQLMSYSGNRTFSTGNLNYNVFGNELVCWSAAKGKILWQRYIDENYTAFTPGVQYLPTRINGLLCIPQQSGGISLIDPQTGIEKHRFNAELPLVSQAIANNNMIYGTGPNGETMAIKTPWQNLNGWKSWNGNAANNSYQK